MSDFIPIYAVDFDGTLCESQWPGIGEPNTKLIQHLIKRRSEGVKLILWTCRCGERLKVAVEWCKNHGLEFDAVNENLPEMKERYGNDCRKIYATCYIDDLAVDKKKFSLPYHKEFEVDYSEFDKYPVGSEWILRHEGITIPVKIMVVNKPDGWIEAHSTTKDGAYKHYAVRREIEWFCDKLFEAGKQMYLTLDELREMPGIPVYCDTMECYGIVKVENVGEWAGKPFLIGAWHDNNVAVNFEYDIEKRDLKCRRLEDLR